MNRLVEIKERYKNRLDPSDEDIEWLIEQAERSKIYKKSLVAIASHKPMSEESGIAGGALIETDLKFDK